MLVIACNWGGVEVGAGEKMDHGRSGSEAGGMIGGVRNLRSICASLGMSMACINQTFVCGRAMGCES